jgi:hypothetical protein
MTWLLIDSICPTPWAGYTTFSPTLNILVSS